MDVSDRWVGTFGDSDRDIGGRADVYDGDVLGQLSMVTTPLVVELRPAHGVAPCLVELCGGVGDHRDVSESCEVRIPEQTCKAVQRIPSRLVLIFVGLLHEWSEQP